MSLGRAVLATGAGCLVGVLIGLLVAPLTLPSGGDLEQAAHDFVASEWTIDEFRSGRPPTEFPWPLQERMPYRVVIRSSTGQSAESAMVFVRAQSEAEGWHPTASGDNNGFFTFDYERGAVDLEVWVFKDGDLVHTRAVSDPSTVRTRHILIVAAAVLAAGALSLGAYRHLAPSPEH